MKAKLGVNHWIAAGFIEANNGKDLAEVLVKNNSLIKHERIGEILGSADEFSRKVLAEFVEKIDFDSLDIVTSLRRFLTYF